MIPNNVLDAFSSLVAVSCLACALQSSCDLSSTHKLDAKTIQQTNLALSSRKLPTLPDAVTDVRCWTGGVFAKYMNVKLGASVHHALDYLQPAGATCYIEFRIEGKQYRVLATHSLTAAPGDIGKPDLYYILQL